MRMGLINIIDVLEMQVISMACESYDLALEQAKELEKGVDLSKKEIFHPKAKNSMRQVIYKYPATFTLVTVQELEIATEVLLTED